MAIHTIVDLAHINIVANMKRKVAVRAAHEQAIKRKEEAMYVAFEMNVFEQCAMGENGQHHWLKNLNNNAKKSSRWRMNKKRKQKSYAKRLRDKQANAKCNRRANRQRILSNILKNE